MSIAIRCGVVGVLCVLAAGASGAADPPGQVAACDTSSARPPVSTLVAPVPPSPPPEPVTTFVLLPGHWKLDGATYVWVKGDDTLRPTAPRPFVQGHYVWRDRAWVWVPDHYE